MKQWGWKKASNKPPQPPPSQQPASATPFASSSSSSQLQPASSTPSTTSAGTFLVLIPADVKPGENFQVMAGGKIFKVRCPQNSTPGQQVKIDLPLKLLPQPQQQLTTGKEANGAGSGNHLPNSSSSADVLSSSQISSDNNLLSNQPQCNNDDTKMFEVIVPKGTKPGNPFALMAGGTRVLVTCPENATVGAKIRFHLPLALLTQPDAPKSKLAEIILSYDKNGWTRTLRATTDMKFMWTRLDKIGNVDQRTKFDKDRSAYVRKLHCKKEKDGDNNDKLTRWCTLVTPNKVAVDSCVKNSKGEDIVTFRDIVAAQMMSYNDKVTWFLNTCKKLACAEMGYKLQVQRSSLLENSISLLMGMHPQDLRKAWMIEFKGEPGLDAGGLMREWFELVTEELFNPGCGLWKNTSGNQLQIHPLSEKFHEEHLTYFRFAGRFMGRAIFTGQLVKAHMAKHLYKHVLGFPIMFNDLRDLDEDYHKNLLQLEKCPDIEGLMVDFTATEEALPWEKGQNKIVDLVPGGSQIEVTRKNLPEYLEACLKYRLMGAFEAQLNEILVGIYEVVPEPLFTIFDFVELELLMCGLPEIDMDDWMANTDYMGDYKRSRGSHPVCMWFWEVVREYDHEMRARLLQFVTGTSGVPSKGFGYLTDHNGIRKFTIQSIPYPHHKLPRSHTCFNRIDLPVFTTREDLEKNLMISITMAATGFDME